LKLDEGLATLIRGKMKANKNKRQVIYFWIIESKRYNYATGIKGSRSDSKNQVITMYLCNYIITASNYPTRWI